MSKYFGTDGVRGVVGVELKPEFVYKLGRAFAGTISKDKSKMKILIGMDTRESKDLLECSISSGICSVGVDVVCVGVIPTPAISYLIRYFKFDAGIVISASHNPYTDNGIKIFNKDGFKLSDELEEQIENIIDDNYKLDNIKNGVGRREYAYLGREYIDFLKSTIDGDLSGINATVDCANGATYEVAQTLFEELSLNLNIIHNAPSGTNINANCGSTHMEDLQKKVIQNKSDIGIAFDGDGDRCLLTDENGDIIDGDVIMAILGNKLKEEGRLIKNTIVATIMSNLGFFIMAKNNDINIIKAKVGDRYVLENMINGGYNLGGEQSGHIIQFDYNTTGDGILTAIKILEIMKSTGKKLSELKKIVNILPQVLINAKVCSSKKYDYTENQIIKNAIEKLEQKFQDDGRVLIRPSGTENLVRVMIEGSDINAIQKEAKELANLIEKHLA